MKNFVCVLERMDIMKSGLMEVDLVDRVWGKRMTRTVGIILGNL